MITVVTCSVIVIILFIAIVIYAQKHRAEKRTSLLHTYNNHLIETSTNCIVCCEHHCSVLLHSQLFHERMFGIINKYIDS